MTTTDFIAAIELGSSKISGIAGWKNNDGSIRILAYAHEEAVSFVRKGNIYNVDKAAHALTSIVGKLEEQLHNSIAKVYVGIGGQSLRTVKNAVSRALNQEGIISLELVDTINDENRDTPLVDMCVLDVAPQEYKIDNASYADPVGVTGQHVTGQFLNIVARNSVKKNLELAFEQADIKIADLFVAPVALARAVLTENEMRSGCALVDFGADTTSVLVYKNNILRYMCVLPLGGNNITRDIVSSRIEEEEAEQLKLEFGNVLYEDENPDTPATCTLADGRVIELSQLNNIIGARSEEIVANAWNQIQVSGYETRLLAGIVLTGGGGNLKNLDAMFRKVSKQEKVKVAHFVRFPVSGFENELQENNRQNTLLGLLAAGNENCCLEIAPQPGLSTSPQLEDPEPLLQPEQTRIGFQGNESKQKSASKEESQQERTSGKKTQDKERQASKRHIWKTLFENISDNFMGDNSDQLSDGKN